MATVIFTNNVQRHVACPQAQASGKTVREVLDNVFADNPQARGYVLDDQAALRKHMLLTVAARKPFASTVFAFTHDAGKAHQCRAAASGP